MQKQHIKSISKNEPIFASKLDKLPQPVAQLRSKGNIDLLSADRPILGIVGARKVTPYGRSVTTELARAAASKGVTIVSGLALGVDSIAHQAALDVRGATIAVLPSGLDKIYPANHHHLARQIIENNGLLISEYQDDFMPYLHSFIERNRIVAALSDVLLITEAAERSGSLHTARFALELGKTIAAVPGNITSSMSRGSNNLLRSGAIPILEPQDLLDLLKIPAELAQKTRYQPENEAETAIIVLLSDTTRSGHDLMNESGLDTPQFQTHLTMLEIKGVIEPQGNNMWRLK